MIKAYVGLTKPRIIELLLITTVPVMFLAAGGVPGLGVVAATLVGGILAAGSANTINCVLDRDIDEQMRRTRRRPLPRHAVSPRSAMVFGIVLGVLATLELGFFVNWLSSVLALVANLFYVFVYTMVLKRRTVAEHRLGRDRRLLPDPDRLDRGHQRPGLDAAGAVRRRVPLDAAAHLGAGDALPRGLRLGRRTDAAGGRHPGRHRAADPRLQHR